MQSWTPKFTSTIRKVAGKSSMATIDNPMTISWVSISTADSTSISPMASSLPSKKPPYLQSQSPSTLVRSKLSNSGLGPRRANWWWRCYSPRRAIPAIGKSTRCTSQVSVDVRESATLRMRLLNFETSRLTIHLLSISILKSSLLSTTSPMTARKSLENC